VTASNVSGNTGGAGISASGGGNITVTESNVSGNTGGGIDISGGAFTIENNMIVNNGDEASTEFGGVKINNTAARSPEVFQFNTVARNKARNLPGNASEVKCVTTSTPTTTNSILYSGLSLTVQKVSGNCSWSYSDIEGGVPTGLDGGNNMNVDPLFVNPGTDYHLQSTSQVIDQADSAGGVTTDIDGETRPQGANYDMGADEAG